MKKLLMLFLLDESGAAAMEYALLASLIAAAIAATVAALGVKVGLLYQSASDIFPK